MTLRFPLPAVMAAVVWLTALPLTALPLAAAAETPPPVSYHKQIRPLFQAHCQGCHQPAKAEGGFVMTDVGRMQAAGDSGAPGIVPGKPEESHLLAQIVPDAAGQAEMPKGGKSLAAADIDLVKRWIAAGAQDDTPASAGQKVDAAHPPVYTRQPVVTSLDFSPDGRLVLSRPVSFDTVYGGCWSPDGKLVAFGCTDNSLRAIDAATG
ncbi:MAG: c-type cytochrome domain-containing protein, partial [Planctomycetia bacterium]